MQGRCCYFHSKDKEMVAWRVNAKCPRFSHPELCRTDTRSLPYLIPGTNLEAIWCQVLHINFRDNGPGLKSQFLGQYQLCDLCWPVWLQWHCKNSSLCLCSAFRVPCSELNAFPMLSDSHLMLTLSCSAIRNHILQMRKRVWKSLEKCPLRGR